MGELRKLLLQAQHALQDEEMTEFEDWLREQQTDEARTDASS